MKALLLACAALAACYSPDARDCTVSCAAAKDCVNGQVCGADHFCAAPGVAGHCSAVDASVTPDTPPPPGDVTLSLTVIGGGRITVEGVATCSDMCMVHVPRNMPLTLIATEIKPNKGFQMWIDACSGSDMTCALTPTMDVHVGARFE